MLSNIRKRNEGFTIIEVLIVLAIAGLIMLIVFLAVPALQRNSRNTQEKSAASALLGAINEYENNNNGGVPTAVAIAADGTISATGTGTPSTGKTQGGYTASVSTTFPANTVAPGTFTIALGYKCTGNTGFAATPRSVAVAYIVETGGTNATQCVGS
jgi:prepilin-type N-terminal cleavage/methylation domain-containing protein